MSVESMMYGIRLLSSALRAVHRARCAGAPGICAKLLSLAAADWKSALRRATTISHNVRLRFLMELPTSFRVYSRDNAAGDLEKASINYILCFS